MSGTLRTTLGSAATAPRAAPSVADEEAPPPPPPFDFAGRRAWLSRADSRLGRVLGAALRDVGCHVHGVRTCGEELDFAAETFLAEPELYNPVRDDARFPRPSRGRGGRTRSSTTALTPTPTATPTARDPDAHRSLSLDRRDTRRTNACACSARTSW